MNSLDRNPICPAALAMASLFALNAERASANFPSITSPTAVSPGVFAAQSGVRTLAALSLGASNPDVMLGGEAAEGASEPVNFRGEKVTGAPVRFHEDFETGQIGREWAAFGGTVERDGLSQFANPSASGGMVLNVKTESESPYEVRLDVYLIPPSGEEEAEQSENVLSIFVDDQPVQTLSPEALRKLSGKRAEPGQPVVRTIHVPFTASSRIAEIRFSAPASSSAGWCAWGIDNMVIDLGLQDPVFGITGGGGGYDSDLLGGGEMGSSDMAGELPPPPRSRYGSNEPFAGSGGGGSVGNAYGDTVVGGVTDPEPVVERPEDPTDFDRNDDGIDDGVEKEISERPERIVPSAPTTMLFVASIVMLVQRRR